MVCSAHNITTLLTTTTLTCGRSTSRPSRTWTPIAYARNVTDSLQYIYRGPGQSTGLPVFSLQQTVYTLSEPRSFGAEVQYRF